MKIKYFVPLSALCLCACAHSHHGADEHHHHHHSEAEEQAEHDHHAHEGHDEHDFEHAGESHEHSDEIHLSEQQAGQFGVVVDTLRAGNFMSGIKVSGRIIANPSQQALVVAPSSGMVNFKSGVSMGMDLSKGTVVAVISAEDTQGGDPVESARIAYESAVRELDRITPLHKDGIVTTARYNEVLQSVELAKAAMIAHRESGSVAKAPISGVLTQLLVSQGEYVQVGQALASVNSATTLTLQADVPVAKADLIPSVMGAQLWLPGHDAPVDIAEWGGRRINASDVMSADASRLSGYRPVYFTFHNPGNVTPGTAVGVNVLVSSRQDVLTLPKTALIEQEGHYFAFVRVHPDAYVKRMVTLGASNGTEYEITSGLNKGEEVVMQGATIVKLAAASGRVPEGHSHNH